MQASVGINEFAIRIARVKVRVPISTVEEGNSRTVKVLFFP